MPLPAPQVWAPTTVTFARTTIIAELLSGRLVHCQHRPASPPSPRRARAPHARFTAVAFSRDENFFCMVSAAGGVSNALDPGGEDYTSRIVLSAEPISLTACRRSQRSISPQVAVCNITDPPAAWSLSWLPVASMAGRHPLVHPPVSTDTSGSIAAREATMPDRIDDAVSSTSAMRAA